MITAKSYKQPQNNIDGIVVLNKPSGMTSHDVVNRVRRKFGMRRVGHAGTLDPLATGVLIMLIGKSTRLSKEFQSFDKAYRATLKLGTTTQTADIEGKILEQKPYEHISTQQVIEVLQGFVGEIEQVPPMVSAIKVGGERLYKLARQGIEVVRTPRKICIQSLRLLKHQGESVEIYVECSKGTYIRQLAEDVGKVLGCGACIAQIERTKVGPFVLEDSVRCDDLTEAHVRKWKQP